MDPPAGVQVGTRAAQIRLSIAPRILPNTPERLALRILCCVEIRRAVAVDIRSPRGWRAEAAPIEHVWLTPSRNPDRPIRKSAESHPSRLSMELLPSRSTPRPAHCDFGHEPSFISQQQLTAPRIRDRRPRSPPSAIPADANPGASSERQSEAVVAYLIPTMPRITSAG